jgi:uncharacterized protein YjbJ (UPF0337 family)
MRKRDQQDMATEGGKDQLKGLAKEVEGRVRDAAGGLSGNTNQQLKGKGQQLKGRIQQAVGKSKQKADPNPGLDDA